MAADDQTQSQGSAAEAPQRKEGNKQTWGEYGRQVYNEQYERWMPWIEDMYLRWFTRDNKASYATKDALGKAKVTGVGQIDDLQDGAHDLVAGQVGQDGLLRPVGDVLSREGINRAERGGRDERGGYAPGPAGAVVDPVVNGGRAVGGAVGGLFGGGSGAAEKK